MVFSAADSALNDLFPGFAQNLAAAGAVPLQFALDNRLERPGFDPFPKRDLGLTAYAMSRPLIEFTVRQRVEQHANITSRALSRPRPCGFDQWYDFGNPL